MTSLPKPEKTKRGTPVAREEAPTSANAPVGRLVSLDVFRGATIAAMLLVNNAGDWNHVYGPLRHAQWHGVTFTDLIFPFFLFIVGVAIVFSLGRQHEKGTAKGAIAKSVVRRALILIALGLLLNTVACFALPWMESFRPMGVLQRIGLCYLAAALLVLWHSPRALVVWFVALCAGYWALMTLVAVPGHGAGDYSREGNLASYADTRVLGSHCYEYDAATGLGHEPEGLLSTVPAVATAIAGCLTGFWLRRRDVSPGAKSAAMLGAGAVLIGAGVLWGLQFPINKNLWTSSYVLFTAGWALVGLAACYWVVDVKGWRWWTAPFVAYGMNAITAYVGVALVAYTTIWVKIPRPQGDPAFLKTWIYEHAFVPALGGISPYLSSAAYGFMYVIVFCALMWALYRKKIFLKV